MSHVNFLSKPNLKHPPPPLKEILVALRHPLTAACAFEGLGDGGGADDRGQPVHRGWDGGSRHARHR